MSAPTGDVGFVLAHRNNYIDAMRALGGGDMIVSGNLKTGRCRVPAVMPGPSVRALLRFGYFPGGKPQVERTAQPSPPSSTKPPIWEFFLREGADFNRFLATLGFGAHVIGLRHARRALLGYAANARCGPLQLHLTGHGLDEERRKRIASFGTFGPSV